MENPTITAKLEDGKIWLRYVGHIGPEANTCLGRMFWGDCVPVAPDKVAEAMTSGDFHVLDRGRCRSFMKFSGERCIQESIAGEDVCAIHKALKGVKNGL